MATAKDIIQSAMAEVGVKESPSGSNNVKYNAFYGMQGIPWCATFVSYCLITNGVPFNIESKKGFKYCPYGVAWFKKKKRWHTSNPKPGDIVFFDWYGNGGAYHVGIVKSYNSDKSVTTIEGNTSVGNDSNGGEVMIRTRRLSQCLGFGRPEYDNNTSIDPKSPGAKSEPFPEWPGKYFSLTTPNLSSNDLVAWKARMKERGWNLKDSPLNLFDDQTHKVLSQFQKEKKLEVDGVLGPISWNAAWTTKVT